MTHILVTNDDGVHAPGLLALVHAMRKLGTVSVLAPDRNWSASGHVKTMSRPLRVNEVVLADGSPALTSDGAPSDCVALVTLGLLPDPVDLVVSGINPNANIGHDATYSGTVTAAMEAAIAGLPGIAVSLDSPDEHVGALDYSPSALIAYRVAKRVLDEGLPDGVFLNVNVPYEPGEPVAEVVITRQGQRVYRDQLEKRIDPRGQPYYWIGGESPTGVEEAGTDFGMLARGFATVTPLQLDLTARDALERLEAWKI